VATIYITVRYGQNSLHTINRQAVEKQKFNCVTMFLLSMVVLKQLEHNLARMELQEGHV
jgi:hypothetical protein